MTSAIAAWTVFGISLLGADGAPAAERKTENVILFTLDGARTQEIFGGLDLGILASVTKKGTPPEKTPAYRKYWASTPEERRRKLMPFFWGELMAKHGSIAGNRALGSTVMVANRHRFSYPGYAEILNGNAHDDAIKTNDPIQNPFPTVLEFAKGELGLRREQVAVFASWEIIKWIAEHKSGELTCNAGFEPYEHPDPAIAELSRFQSQTPPSWDEARFDAYTFRFALAHLERYKPRLLFISFDDTDDWAHRKQYDRTLDALHRSDAYIRTLWEALERIEEYRGRTTLILTADHGRGNTPKDWCDHGEKTEGAQYVWLAVASPDVALRGEWRDSGTQHLDQVAATICRFLGLDPQKFSREAGPPIERLFMDR